MAEPEYGAFSDILTLDDADDTTNADTDFKYGVYQLATQKPELEEGELQKLYGTSFMPIYEWVKTIQTGERTYDPNDFEDRKKLDEYKQYGQVPGLLSPEEIERQLISDVATGVASQIGTNVGQAIAEGVDSPITSGLTSAFGFGDLPGDVIINPEFDLSSESFTKLNAQNKLLQKTVKGGEYLFNPAVANEKAAIASGNLPEYKALKGDGFVNIGTKESPLLAFKGSGNEFDAVDVGNAKIKIDIEGTNPKTDKPFQTYSSKTLPEGESSYWDRVKSDAGSKSTAYSSAGAGIGTFFTDLFLTKGEDPVKSAKKGAGAAVGTYIGTVLGGPIGSVVGATVGASIGGRVICNELRRNGLMSTEDILTDYYFTQKYLTPTHVNGYHIWALSVVRKMRKGKSIKLWHHIATHRLNEVKYILGKRNKPDYLGKIYRFVGESLCFIIGKFCKKTDWSVLYNKKEI
tara:strand:- start:464 stop:1846 length:1383 start_codon:yes stop_codon:yes gene_type:complete